MTITRAVKCILFWYFIVYVPLGLLLHSRAYVAFANHRASGIPFELLTLFDGSPYAAQSLFWSWPWPPWRLQAGFLHIGGKSFPAAAGSDVGSLSLSVLWGSTAEEKMIVAERMLHLPSVSWTAGGPVSGERELTLVGRSVDEFVAPSPQERWCGARQRYVPWGATVSRIATYVYNMDRIWHWFSVGTANEVSLDDSPEVARAVAVIMSDPDKRHRPFPAGTFSEVLPPGDNPLMMAAKDEMVSTARHYRAGAVSRELLLGAVRVLYFRYAGPFLLPDSFIPLVLWWVFLYLPTLPIRYLLFAPLVFSPHYFVLPLALLHGLTLMVLWFWVMLRWRRTLIF
ncbi:MAG: hypothetical protein AB1445_14990 [Bacillota bacterium]